MDSDENYHSESEFYYPDELENEEIDIVNNELDNDGTTETSEEMNVSFIQDFITAQRPENTLKKTKYDMNIWQRHFLSINENREIKNIPPRELNVLMCRFFIDLKKKNGSPYEPVTLTSFYRSLQRYLNDNNSAINIFRDQQFAKAREVLSAKKRELVVENAKGNRPQAARELSDAEEDQLFFSGAFGNKSPEALQTTVWWLLSLHFGFRARDESRKLKWGDVQLKEDGETGQEFLLWSAERGSKTRKGDGQRAFSPVAYATNNERCPVKYFKEYVSRRPDEMKDPESPFYLAINHRRKTGSQIWYSRAPLGRNEIGKLLVKAAQKAGLSGNITNHSFRKTCISRLMDAEIPANYVAQLSGHKNLKSLDSYKSASVEHQRKMSHVLSRSFHQHGSESGESTTTVASAGTSSMLSTSACTSFGPVNPSNPTVSGPSGLFSGASIGKIEGCTFNFHIHNNEGISSDLKAQPQMKRRRIILQSDDSDTD